MERFLQKPFTDPNRSVCIEQALIRAYESNDRDAIAKAAREAQAYVDEVGDFDWKFDDDIEDYIGHDAERLTWKYLLRLTHDRTMDGGDADRDYILTGWHISLDQNYKQFKEFKKRYPDAVLLFRDGDVGYDAYEDDADKVAKACGVPLLNWNGVKAAGFPHNALDIMLPRLIRAGHRVAVCDKLEAPKPKPQKRITETVKRKEPVQLSLW